jgi:hypothetical protein
MPATIDAHYQSDIILIGGRVADTTVTGGITMNASSEGMRGLRLALDYTPHPGFFGVGHIAGSSVAAAAGLTCLSYGVYGWAAFFLIIAALNLAGGSWYLTIARSASARN